MVFFQQVLLGSQPVNRKAHINDAATIVALTVGDGNVWNS